jgi:two-component system phosphate regulon sensor histidine kinase PhoR
MLRPLYVNVVVGASIAAVLFALVSLWLARRISLPLEELRRGAERFARGEFDRRLPLPALDEVRVLADSMNHMAAQLAERLTTVTQQRNELATILRSMSEGVLAVDSDRRVVTMNDACARILDVEGGACTGRPIHETFRNASLQTLIDQVLQSTEPVEGEVVLRNGGERHVQVHGAVLRDPEAHERGAVLVLNDVTRLQRLETMRRDFVANVSHELKTPVTSIKAAIETLTEGGSGDPDASRRFLAIAARQVDRLEAIIEDLLRLSRLEDEAGRGVIELVPGPLDTVLAGAAQTCERLAREKEITLEVTCPPDARARMNAPLLENAVVNLVNNAIKYSAPGGRVTLAAAVEGPEVIVSVRDTGCGIDQRYHERIFERFFRVDRARSRELGGTGLGLAIVKHIVLAHGGRVSVDSTPGRGSVFTLSLPHA